MGKTGCLVVLVAGAVAVAAGDDDKIQLQVVKYQGLMETLQQQRGKVVFVDFWGDFCVPCKRAFPHVVALHRKFAGAGLVVITVSLDELKSGEGEQTKGRVLAFLKKQDARFTNLLLDEPYQVWQQKLRFMGPPCCFVFNRQGRWTQFSTDRDEDIDYAAVEKLIEKSIHEK